MALAPFRRERAVKEILLVKALPLRVVLLYRTAGWNARLFRKSLCKRLCKSLKTLSSAGGRPFRRSSGAAGGGEKSLFPFPSAEGRPSADPAAQPVEAKKRLFPFPSAEGRPSADTAAQPVEARFTPSEGVGSGRLRRPGVSVPTDRGRPCPRRGGLPGSPGGDKRGQGHRMVPFPPLDSPKPSFAPRRLSVARRNGGYGGSVPCVVSLMGRCYALRSVCVICRA